MPRTASHLTLFTVATLLATTAEAQVRVVDEGTFTLFSGGQRIGREDFSIRAVPATGGGTFIAQGNVLVGDRRLSMALTADSGGFPTRYTFETIVDGRVVETISGESRRGIWLGRAMREGGESAREFRLPAGTVAAEPGVVHPLWFVLRRAGGSPPAILLPRTLSLAEVVIEDAGPDNVTLGLRDFVTRRWVIRPVRGDWQMREAWTDLQGRVLRVRVPSLDLEALRDEPPRETPGG